MKLNGRIIDIFILGILFGFFVISLFDIFLIYIDLYNYRLPHLVCLVSLIYFIVSFRIMSRCE